MASYWTMIWNERGRIRDLKGMLKEHIGMSTWVKYEIQAQTEILYFIIWYDAGQSRFQCFLIFPLWNSRPAIASLCVDVSGKVKWKFWLQLHHSHDLWSFHSKRSLLRRVSRLMLGFRWIIELKYIVQEQSNNDKRTPVFRESKKRRVYLKPKLGPVSWILKCIDFKNQRIFYRKLAYHSLNQPTISSLPSDNRIL